MRSHSQLEVGPREQPKRDDEQEQRPEQTDVGSNRADQVDEGDDGKSHVVKP